MARNRDIAGLLTGIPSGGFAQNMMEMSRELGTRFGSGVTGMMTGDIRTPNQQLTGGIKNFQNLSEEEQKNIIGRLQSRGETGIASQLRADLEASTRQKQKEAMAGLDLTNPEDLMKLAKMQQASGDLKGAVSTLKTAQNLQQQAGLKEGLLKIARSQGNQEMIDFIEAGGSLQTASTKLLGDKTTTTGVSTLTETEKKEYEDYFDIISDEELEKAGVSTGIFANITGDKGAKNRLMYQAEQIYTNAVKQKRPLTRQQALLEAMNITSSGSSVVPTADGATPRGQQKDSFVGTPIKG